MGPRFRHFGKQFPRDALRAQIGKGTDQYLPQFLTPDEIERFGKDLDEYRSEISEKNIFRACARSRRCANSSSEFAMTGNGSCSPVR
jgi:hypothetical protein